MPIVELQGENFLYYEQVGNPQHDTTICILHGIMGKSSNLLHFTKKLLDNLENTNAILFDLRNHGRSKKNCSPYTVTACGNDVVEALEKLSIEPKVLIGHSFGAKVAFLAATKLESVTSLWILDSILGQKDLPLNTFSETLELLSILKKTSFPFASRKEFSEELLKNGVEKNTALWMTTNLEEREGGLYLVFNPFHMEQMLVSFYDLDLWPMVNRINNRCALNFVKAEFGFRITAQEEASIKAHQNCFFHLLKNSGHIVHNDNPSGLIEIIKNQLVTKH